jgi:hypothetical protein
MSVLQTMIKVAHRAKRKMPTVFNVVKIAVPRPVRKRLYRTYFEREINQNASVQTIFENIYYRNWWQSDESHSGTGSELSQTQALACKLEAWLAHHAAEVSTFLDAPCGDFNWMGQVNLCSHIQYIGGDIVRSLIQINRDKFQSHGRSFIELDIIKGPIPNADAWLCRDAMIHFPFSAGAAVVENFRSSRVKYFLGTTFTNATNEEDIPFGWCRETNLSAAPFNLGSPIELICDSRGGREPNRYIGIWRNPNL